MQSRCSIRPFGRQNTTRLIPFALRATQAIFRTTSRSPAPPPSELTTRSRLRNLELSHLAVSHQHEVGFAARLWERPQIKPSRLASNPKVTSERPENYIRVSGPNPTVPSISQGFGSPRRPFRATRQCVDRPKLPSARVSRISRFHPLAEAYPFTGPTRPDRLPNNHSPEREWLLRQVPASEEASNPAGSPILFARCCGEPRFQRNS